MEFVNMIAEDELADRLKYRVARIEGNIFYYNRSDELHREEGPAIEYIDGTKEWFKNGKIHREDGPAVEWANGDREWYRNGKRHREDGPAIEYASGKTVWFLNGVRQHDRRR